MKKTLIAALIVIFAGSAVAGPDDHSKSGMQQLDEELGGMLKDTGPGTSVVVTRGKDIIFEEYYGLADVESGEKLGRDHMIGIASMTKQFTGMAVLFLAEEGKLRLGDRISDYLPDLPLGGREITVRQLLSHTSGLPELTRNDEFMNSIADPHTVAQIIDMGLKGEFRSEPGEQYIYCNTGFTIVTALIEKLSGTSYSDFLDRRIFGPLGMENTVACDFERDADMAVKRYISTADGYERARVMHFSNLIGGGSIVSNSMDIAKWCMALVSGESLPADYKLLWEPVRLRSGEVIDYGLGMGISELDGRRFYYHPGMGDGMNSIDLIFPAEEVTINVICNDSNPAHTSKDIALLAARLVLGS